MQGKALLDRTKRPSQMEKGVSFFKLLQLLLTRYDLVKLQLSVTQKEEYQIGTYQERSSFNCKN